MAINILVILVLMVPVVECAQRLIHSHNIGNYDNENVTYEDIFNTKCNSEQPIKNYNEYICWTHIPKTSSWIGDMLFRMHCPGALTRLKTIINEADKNYVRVMLYDKWAWWNLGCDVKFCPCIFGYHEPFYVKAMAKARNVVMLRNSYQRIISQYLFGDNGVPMMVHGLGLAQSMKDYLLSFKDAIKEDPTIFTIYNYSMTPGIANCQTKMLLGYGCANSKEITKKDAEEAIDILRNSITFFGLTAQPKATMLLYTAMFNISRVGKYEHYPPAVRVNIGSAAAEKKRLQNILRKNDWRDYDSVVYHEAKQIFYERCKKYKISLEKTNMIN